YLEALPAALARARGNATARWLARSDWLLRRKSDGRFIAVRRGDRLHELQRGGLLADLRADLATLPWVDAGGESPRPLDGLLERLQSLGLNEDYGVRSGLALVAEPGVLSYAGRDRYARPLWLTCAAARAWQTMRVAAARDGLQLQAISGYRSHAYQLGIFQRKLARGQSVVEILAVNAAPGYSEHHSGNAMDISAPGEPAAEESFEHSSAFGWLQSRAKDFGFTMSYPRDNPYGIVYEPWHWRHASAR
ncbi:MAG: M15 family metallopeptidase, partial [Arenimonas sp.]